MTSKELHETVKKFSDENPQVTIMFLVEDNSKDYGTIQGTAIDLAANLASVMQSEAGLVKVCQMALHCYENVK